MMRPFASFSELILALFITLLCVLPVLFVIKMLLKFSSASLKKCYYSLVLSVFLSFVFLYLYSLNFVFFEFYKSFVLLHFALGICAFCFFILALILAKNIIFNSV